MTQETSSEKKTELESQPRSLKRSNSHLDIKGVAQIKRQYIIENVIRPAIDDDEMEGNVNNNPKYESLSKRGQNKNRDLRQPHETIRLCSSLIDPDNLNRKCKFGAENCRNTHDIDFYLKSKEKEIEGACPVFEAIGYCPAGLKCRWLSSHFNFETKTLVKDLEKYEKTSKTDKEINCLEGEIKYKLQKKNYKFEKSEQFIPYLNILTKNNNIINKTTKEDKEKNKNKKIDKENENNENENKDEKNENNENENEKAENTKQKYYEYVEPPFLPCEKKKLDYNNKKILSPLTTVGNLPFRRLLKKLYDVDITYSEMALALPLIQGSNSEWALPKAHISEYPGFGVQIATAKHWEACKASEAISKLLTSVSEINLNCGCPIDLLYRAGAGSALMDQPSRLIRILKGMNACSDEIPITVKIRMGVRDNKPTAIPLVKRLINETDVKVITLHGRSRQQRYTKESNWDYIAEVGKVVEEMNLAKMEDKELRDDSKVFFVGNGDVYNYEDYYNNQAREGVDSVMIARGGLIKPWIFEEIDKRQHIDKSSSERLEILKEYSKLALEHWGSDEYGVGLSRRFLCEFISFFHRYIPVGILERLPSKLNERPPNWRGRDEMETLLGSSDYKDWIKISEMFLGPANKDFQFQPKHKSSAYDTKE
ncbi:tRNA dihydrouridine synthase DUS3 [Ascoidea rubescens DSM 1968]|uniref:tRNA-dihydrouridine(47) synthase [NAD(P)(+)] n=1 Tax=Ascoidea rubescens DSM 1968 TaxID=1344418 RepID=A0A1D2VQC4_9ASCO|nr:FMN-linked oxidoreductase [Ascoidea rubescens DSM 1968]ODV63816.1 FMN-linked oxidoreductase [Ascoidea rubescens DSM 1968]